MILVGNFLIAIGQLLSGVITFFLILLFARAILSWVNPDPNNFIVKLITDCTEPLMVGIRPYIPNFGMLDMSLLVVFLGLMFIQSFVAVSMMEYGALMKASSFSGATSSPVVMPDNSGVH